MQFVKPVLPVPGAPNNESSHVFSIVYEDVKDVHRSLELIVFSLHIGLWECGYCRQVSSDQNPCYLLYIGDYTAQLYRGYKKPL